MVVYSAQIVYILFSDDLLVMFEGLRTPSAEQARLRNLPPAVGFEPERKGGLSPKFNFQRSPARWRGWQRAERG